MIRLYYLIDNPEKELNPFAEILSVKVGSTIADQKLLQKVSFLTNASPTRFYFSIRNNESTDFIYKIIESGFHNVRDVHISEVWRNLKNENCQSLKR